MARAHNPGRKRLPMTQAIIDIIHANPTLNRLEIMAIVWQQFPEYSEDQFRQLLLNNKIYCKPAPRRKHAAPPPPGRVKPAATPVRLSASVHSYHGRSRLQPGYYEL